MYAFHILATNSKVLLTKIILAKYFEIHIKIRRCGMNANTTTIHKKPLKVVVSNNNSQ